MVSNFQIDSLRLSKPSCDQPILLQLATEIVFSCGLRIGTLFNDVDKGQFNDYALSLLSYSGVVNTKLTSQQVH
jgi:hypothetical protein